MLMKKQFVVSAMAFGALILLGASWQMASSAKKVVEEEPYCSTFHFALMRRLEGVPLAETQRQVGAIAKATFGDFGRDEKSVTMRVARAFTNDAYSGLYEKNTAKRTLNTELANACVEVLAMVEIGQR